jgi:hypothetical protein
VESWADVISADAALNHLDVERIEAPLDRIASM